jgi:polysaccharide export outer membrane protein
MRVRIFLVIVSLLVLSVGPVAAQKKQQGVPPSSVTIQQANQKLQLLANADRLGLPHETTLNAGDTIKVDVFGIPELSQQVQIGPSGYITMPLIPQRIQAAGLTPFQLESKIAGQLKSLGLVSHPQVSVIVVQRMGQPITVIGAVEHPMIYQAVRPTTLLEVLSAAGGLADTAADYVTVTRTRSDGTSNVRRISLRDLIETGDPSDNILLQGNDVVSVPQAGIIYVVGAVARPGGFVIQGDRGQMTALKALALAGGTQPAARTKDAVIIRKEGTARKTQEIRVNLKKILSQKAEDVALRPNDILFIPDSAGKKALAKAAQTALSITTGVLVVRGGSL